MAAGLEYLKRFLVSPTGKTAVKYSAVSAISIVVSQAVLALTYGVGRVASAVDCNFIATAVATVPSYYLNRRWAWGKRGSSHLFREVIPFWVTAFAGLVFSLWAVHLAESSAHNAHLSHLATSVIVNFASLASYGILWVGKFILFNRYLFGSRVSSSIGSGDATEVLSVLEGDAASVLGEAAGGEKVLVERD